MIKCTLESKHVMENNQIEPYKMEKLKFWDKPYKTGKEAVHGEKIVDLIAVTTP